MSHKMNLRNQDLLKIVMYTHGTGSGHLARVNSVYLGFRRANIPIRFCVYAPRTKYRHLLNPGIVRLRRIEDCEDNDVFVCDWGWDAAVAKLTPNFARIWIGLKRLGKIAKPFPDHFHIIGIEPGVKCDTLIWPIIGTFSDEVFSRKEVRSLLNIENKNPLVLCCENGAYSKHLDPVFNASVPCESNVLRCSNAPYADGLADINYYPAAQLFRGVDYLVLGGGYNSIHEAMAFADLDKVTFINVGGDDQLLRIKMHRDWEVGRDSRVVQLAQFIAHELI